MHRGENPWVSLPDQAPYVLDQDRKTLGAAEREEAHGTGDTRLDFGVLPEPYLGSPRAPVVLLLLSPGANGIDAAELRASQYGSMQENLLHRPLAPPFL